MRSDFSLNSQLKESDQDKKFVHQLCQNVTALSMEVYFENLYSDHLVTAL